ncbi:lithostathine-1 [Halyomorpha halys]|uniref:lithostathine-1 n=1 Tax=Halyomorpha halys TaxID=286706 RepID=UPI0006D4F150|nr:lithostathine-1-like [Halyomorpha halys]
MFSHLMVTIFFLTSFAGLSVAAVPNRLNNSTAIKMRYKCQSPYRRIGNRCYYLSEDKLPWRDSQFACNDLNHGYLAKLDKNWKDRKLRNFLNRSKDQNERWIGSSFDDRSQKWIWAKGGEALRYRGFSQKRPHENYRWRCAIMNPTIFFRWSTRSCLATKKYICEIPIQILGGVNESIKRKHLKGGKNRRISHRKKYQSALSNQLN